MTHTLLINYHELWLKGKNKPYYLKKLRIHLKKTFIRLHGDSQFKYINERFEVESQQPFSEEFLSELIKIPGLHSVDIVVRTTHDPQKIFEALLNEVKKMSFDAPKTFRISTKRANKNYPLTGPELSRQIGGRLDDAIEKLSPKMKNFDYEFKIRVLDHDAFVVTRRLEGIGGLPLGTSGRMITLLSGGFDSPVASFLMSKRGVDQDFIFFHAYPFVGDEIKVKIKSLATVLKKYQRKSFLYIASFGKLQQEIAKNSYEEYRTFFFRKAMIEAATHLAHQSVAEGLIMGDALGQVSSQTLTNIGLLDKCTDLPILRPLIGFNKSEIIQLSEKIGTHDISIIPHDDACSLFAPKSPVIKANQKVVNEFTKHCDTFELTKDIELEKIEL